MGGYAFVSQGEHIGRPDVPIVRVIDYDEQNETWAECLRDAGYEVKLAHPERAASQSGHKARPMTRR